MEVEHPVRFAFLILYRVKRAPKRYTIQGFDVEQGGQESNLGGTWQSSYFTGQSKCINLVRACQFQIPFLNSKLILLLYQQKVYQTCVVILKKPKYSTACPRSNFAKVKGYILETKLF